MENQALDLDMQIRLTAMQLAVAASAKFSQPVDVVNLANAIAAYLKGETTNG